MKMTVVRRSGVALLLMMAMCASASAGDCDAACKKGVIDAYFERLSAVYRLGSTSREVDKLFELFAPKVRYAHKEYEANFERAEWREAFDANLKRGAYSKHPDEQIEITQLIHGQRHSAVEYRHMRKAEDGSLQPADDQGGLLALFGFDGDRICLVEEYW
jgi:hypothetical protein